MHIIIGGLLALAALIWAIIRVMDAVKDAQGAARKFSWSRKVNRKFIDNLQDPREGAAILVSQVATYDGVITAKEIELITRLMRETFGASESEAEELFAVARHALSEIADVGNSLNKVLAPIQKNCSGGEREQLIGMMTQVAAASGPPSDMKTSLINRVRQGLLPT